MNEDRIAELVAEIDRARIAGDTARILELEAEIREITGGKPRQLSGTSQIIIPTPGTVAGGDVEDFDKWNRPS